MCSFLVVWFRKYQSGHLQTLLAWSIYEMKLVQGCVAKVQTSSNSLHNDLIYEKKKTALEILHFL